MQIGKDQVRGIIVIYIYNKRNFVIIIIYHGACNHARTSSPSEHHSQSLFCSGYATETIFFKLLYFLL
jgi:hypothetical protein